MLSIYRGRKRSYDEAFIRPSFTSSKRRKVSGQSLTPYRRMAPLRTGGFWGPQSRSLKEYKFLDTNISVVPYAANSTLTLINGITQGTDYNQRIGRQIKMMNYFIRLTIAPQDTTTDTGSYRILLVYDLQANGVAPTPTEVLVSNTTTSHINLDNRDRFRVLRDKMYTFDPFAYDPAGTATTAWNKTNQNIKIFVKLPNLETIFNATNGGTVADIASGNLIAFWLGSGTGNNGPLDFTGSYRVRFEDK